MTVWVVQNVHWVDRVDGQLKPKFDFAKAERFGRVEYLLEPGASPFSLAGPLKTLQEKLQDYDARTDFLLLVGSPVLIGLAVAIACGPDNAVNMLQWSGAKRDYIPCMASGIF